MIYLSTGKAVVFVSKTIVTTQTFFFICDNIGDWCSVTSARCVGVMGRKKITITRIQDERNRQVRKRERCIYVCLHNILCKREGGFYIGMVHVHVQVHTCTCTCI